MNLQNILKLLFVVEVELLLLLSASCAITEF